MAKRYFGLDIGPLNSYLAVLDIEGNELKRFSFSKVDARTWLRS